MKNSILLTQRLYRFITAPPEDMLYEAEFDSLDHALECFEINLLNNSSNILIAKNIAYSTTPEKSSRSDKLLTDFYSSFRHANNTNRTYPGICSLAYIFYQAAEQFFRSKNNLPCAEKAARRTTKYSGIKPVELCNEKKAAYVSLGKGMEYYSPTPWKENSVLAVTNKGTMVGIGPSGPFKVPQLDFDDHIKSFIKTDSGWFFVGANAKNVYECDADFQMVKTHHPQPKGNVRVQSCRTKSGFALFPYNNTIWLYDPDWKLKEVKNFPQANLISEPSFHGGKIYFRNANQCHIGSELLVMDEDLTIQCIADGFDFAPKCSFVDSVISWPNRTSLYLTIFHEQNIRHAVIPLANFNALEPNYFAKGYDIVPMNDEYWMFIAFENHVNQNDFLASMIRLDKTTFLEFLEDEHSHHTQTVR